MTRPRQARPPEEVVVITFNVRSVQDAQEVLRKWAHDGDTVQLVGPAAGQYSKLAVESTAMGLGLDVVVVVADKATDRVTGS